MAAACTIDGDGPDVAGAPKVVGMPMEGGGPVVSGDDEVEVVAALDEEEWCPTNQILDCWN
jgi:hypothetical protein